MTALKNFSKDYAPCIGIMDDLRINDKTTIVKKLNCISTKDMTLKYYNDNNEVIYKVGIGKKIYNINEAIENRSISYFMYLIDEPLMENNIEINIKAFKKILEFIDKEYQLLYCLGEMIEKLPDNIIIDNLEAIIKSLITENIIFNFFGDFIYIITLLMYLYYNDNKEIIFNYLFNYLQNEYYELFIFLSKLFKYNYTNKIINEYKKDEGLTDLIKRNSYLLLL